MHRRLAALSLVLLVPLVGCASTPERVSGPLHPFDFERDTFAFANELYWTYRFDPDSGEILETFRNENVRNGQRCVTMARASRQFLYHARFDPRAPKLAPDAYAGLVRAVLDTNPRSEWVSQTPVVIPGYPNLRAFSTEQAAVIQPQLGARWESYLQRGNWRMLFPFSPSHQRDTVRSLQASLARGRPPIVHAMNFPGIDLNHTVVVFAMQATPTQLFFDAYDPNQSGKPVRLVFDRARARFHFPATTYFPGGFVKVYEVYDGWLL